MDVEQNGTPEKEPVWQKAFLGSFRQLGIVGFACTRAKVGRTTVYARRKDCPEFKTLWDQAREDAMDRLEREATRRAVVGLERKKFTGKGEPIQDPETGEQYAEREYSDTLLIFLLKGGRPEKFRERYDVTGKVDSEVKHEHTHHVDTEHLAAVVRILAEVDALAVVGPGAGRNPETNGVHSH